MGAIEKLPEEIIHRIQSFLEAQELGKTSVLSKLWLRAWRTQPILQCDEHYFHCRKNFVKYVNSSLLRYQEKKISIEKFTLIFKKNGYDWTSLLSEWIGIAIEIGLKKLELVNVPRQSSLPPIVFESELLEDLSINLHPFYDSFQFPEKISCFRLKRLSFSNISFDGGAVEKLLSICQCIEFLNICEVDVEGKELKLVAKNLRELHVDSCVFGTLEVEAPNLEFFTCSNCPDNSSWLYLKTTQNLKSLKLFRTCFNYQNWFGYNSFPKLENLIIQDCPNLSDLKVTSQIAPKNLYVDSCNELKYLSVEGSNIIRFDFCSRNNFIPITISFKNHLSTCSVSNIHLDVLDSRKFWRLKNLLRNLRPSRISLSINRINDATMVSKHGGLEKGYKLPIPIHELSLGQPTSAFSLTGLASESPSFFSLDFSAILDGLFCTCRPTIIKLATSPPWYHCYDNELIRFHDNELIQFLVWKLMVQKNQFEHDNLSLWQRDLKEVKVDFLTKNDQGEWKSESWNWETFLNMSSKVQLLICVTCDWVRSPCFQSAKLF